MICSLAQVESVGNDQLKIPGDCPYHHYYYYYTDDEPPAEQ
jgi:hypothetical protein